MSALISLAFPILLTLGLISGLLLKRAAASSAQSSHRALFNIVKHINVFCSVIIVSPIQWILNMALIAASLVALIYLATLLKLNDEITVYIAFTLWMMSLQFYPKKIYDFIEKLINKISGPLKPPRAVSDFIKYIFSGKLIMYIIAASFVILNQVSSIANLDFMFDEFIKVLMRITNAAILTFLAIDRVIDGLRKWNKA